MDRYNLNVSFVQQSCYRCGVPFLYPAELDDERKRDHRKFYCPNGHAQRYVPNKENRNSPERLRALQKLHDEEQAEARERDMRRREPKAVETLPRVDDERLKDAICHGPTPPGVRMFVPADYQRRDEYGRLVCPHCDRRYLQTVRLGKHVRTVHKIDPWTAKPPAAGEGEK